MHAVDSTTNASSKLEPSFGYARLLNDLLASNRSWVCSGQVISDSFTDFFDVDSHSKALGDILIPDWAKLA